MSYGRQVTEHGDRSLALVKNNEQGDRSLALDHQLSNWSILGYQKHPDCPRGALARPKGPAGMKTYLPGLLVPPSLLRAPPSITNTYVMEYISQVFLN
jgi:hypothetical protein